jgi:hypothetical protein
MPAWLQALAGALLGGVLVAASNYLLFRADQKASATRELAVALADFTGVLDQLGNELNLIPPTQGGLANALQRGLSSMPNLDSSVRELSQRLWAPHLRPLIERFHLTGAMVMLTAPPEVMACVTCLTNLLGEAEERKEDWPRRWTEARGELIAASRASLGQPAL